MNHLKKSISMALALLMFVTVFSIVPLTAGAEEKEDAVYTSGDYNYLLCEDGTAEIIGYKGSDQKIVVPSKLDEKDVSVIGTAAFGENKTLTGVTIPESVKYIDDFAFAGDESITEINLPDRPLYIGKSVFETTGYYSDKENWKDGVLYIGNHLIAGDDSLTGDLIIKDGTLDIAQEAFVFNKGIKSVTMPETLEIVNASAFDRCNALTSVSLSKELKYLGDDAFTFTPVTEINIPDGIEKIGQNVFEECKQLKTVTFPKNLKSVGADAFKECESLTEAILPDTVVRIDDRAFYNCKNLNSFKIPEVVPELGCAILYGTPFFNEDALYIGKNLFNVNYELKGKFTIKDGTKVIAGEAFSGCNISDVIFPDSVEIIGYGAFSGCRELTNVNIGKGVKKIGAYAFDSSYIKSVTIPDGVESIGARAFYTCNYLDSVEIPASVSEIGEAAFGYYSYYYKPSEDVNQDGYISDKAKDVFEILGKEGTAAEKYAKDNNITFKVVKQTQKTEAEKNTEPKTTTPKKTTPKTEKKNVKNENKKKANSLTVKKKTKTVKLKKLKKKSRTVKPLMVKNARGKVTYKLIKKGTNKKIYKYLKLSKKGTLTVKKWKKAKKGTYNIIIKVTAAGNKSYKKVSKNVTVKIKIK